MLPIANTTAEMIAEWIAINVRTTSAPREGTHLPRIEVEESFGQSATYSEPLTPHRPHDPGAAVKPTNH